MERPAGIMIRVGSLEGYRSLVRELGCDPASILQSVGIDPATLDEPDRLISTECCRQALNGAARETGIARFGLILSQRQSFEKLGAIGYLARNAPTLAVAIDRLARFVKTHDAGSLNALEVEDDIALWTHRIAGVAEESSVQQTELSVGLGCGFVRAVLSEDWCPDRVLFEHAAPANVETYARIFRCPVQFDQPVTAMEFPASDLHRPLRTANRGLFDILERHVIQITSQIPADFPSQVKAQIQAMIENSPVRVDLVAEQFGLPRHSLQNKLRALGTNFHTLLDDVRFEMARRYLRESSLSIAEISAILGYAEPAVFTRFFQRRSGQTPRRWRVAQVTA